MDLRRATTVDQVVAAQHLFDGPARRDATEAFLADPRHHMFIAYVDGAPAGMVTGVELTHPDKGTEMFLYELGVDEAHQRRGIGTALAQRLAEVAHENGCYDMWVLVDVDNAPALATYRRSGATEDSPQVMQTWQLS